MSNEDDEGWVAYGPVGEEALQGSATPIGEARRQAARERRLTERRFANAPFPLYGLPPSWKGARFLGGGSWGSYLDQEEVYALSLVHGTLLQGEAPMLVVETAVPGPGRSGGGTALRVLAEFLWVGEATTVRDALTSLGARAVNQRDQDLSPLPAQAEATVPVDSSPVVFDVVSGHAAWVAQAMVGANKVTIEGRDGFDIQGVQLEQVRDLGPYIEGSRQP